MTQIVADFLFEILLPALIRVISVLFFGYPFCVSRIKELLY